MMTTMELPKVPRNEIDSWPIPEAGLDARVVNCMAAAQVRTVGELRGWKDSQLLHLRNFGEVSLRNVRWFFRWTERLESGDYRLESYRDLLREVLNRQHIHVIERRRELNNRLFRPSMRVTTLQEIANELGGLTRERVRQVEESALVGLRSRLARALGGAIEIHFLNRMAGMGGVVGSEELGDWVGDPVLGGYQPWGTLLLISTTMTHLHHRYGCFFGLLPSTLDRIEQRALAVLQQSARPVPLTQLQAELGAEMPDLAGPPERLLRILLGHHPEISTTRDGRAFVVPEGAAQIVTEILRENPASMHFREVTDRYNQRVLPRNARGPGFVLGVLKSIPVAECVVRSVYRYKSV